MMIRLIGASNLSNSLKTRKTSVRGATKKTSSSVSILTSPLTQIGLPCLKMATTRVLPSDKRSLSVLIFLPVKNPFSMTFTENNLTKPPAKSDICKTPGNSIKLRMDSITICSGLMTISTGMPLGPNNFGFFK